MNDSPRSLESMRYEVLPFASAVPEAEAVARPLTLTVTCSPKHGLDETVEMGGRLRALGHAVIVHLAARMVQSIDHLDAVLGRMSAIGIADVFLVGGDAPEPLGPWSSAVELLPELRARPQAPRSVGVAAYPEGHPLIASDALGHALREKALLADYMTTQLCFDPDALRRWLIATREAGVELPVYVGLPGMVDRRRLLEISMRIGVGASLSFLRKQHGVRRLFGGQQAAAAKLYRATVPLIGGDMGVSGAHFFTFNRLVATVGFAERERNRRWALGRYPATDMPPSALHSPAIEQELKT